MPHFVDVEIGSRVRDARLAKNMTQTELGKAIGISFQQVQKYEKGTNRISGSRLWMLSKVLDVPIVYFFDGIEGEDLAAAAAPDALEQRLPDPTIRVARVLNEMPDGEVKQQVFQLIKAFAKTG